jgi:organic radical activating enzyme
MFGQNKIAKVDWSSGQSLHVREIFPTIQGEGPDAGTPAIFIRLGGCNLRCYFCDTDFDLEKSPRRTLREICADVGRAAIGNKTSLVVLTGGEPLRQDVVPLTGVLNSFGYRVQVETAGTLCPPDLGSRYYLKNPWQNTIVCSPKTPKLSDALEPLITCYKYVVREGEVAEHTDGLPTRSTQIVGQPAFLARPLPGRQIFLQPIDERSLPDQAARSPDATKINMELAVRLAMKFGYRVSLQLHKILNLP